MLARETYTIYCIINQTLLDNYLLDFMLCLYGSMLTNTNAHGI